jgi:AraC-like DNA-binding protein
MDTALPAPATLTGAAGLLAQAWARSRQRRVLFDTSERDGAQAMVSRVFRPHRLEPQRTTRLRASMQHLGTGLLGVIELHYGDTVDILPGPLESFYLLQMPIAGHAHIETAGRSFVSNAACASLVSPSADLRMRWLAGNAQLCVRIEAETVRRFVAAWSGRPCTGTPVFEPQLALDSQPMLVDALLSLIEAADHGATEGGTLCAAQLQYRLLAALLGGAEHDAREQLQGKSPPLAPHSVRKVEDYLVAHCDEPLTPESLAALAGVSIRSLFLGFQRYRGVSPMRMLHELRLRRAHEELLQSAPGTRITDVAHRWGLGHLGRFSRDYRESFGESPSQTLQAASSLIEPGR